MIIVECPNCKISIVVEELNCRIFRCGVLKSNNTQINPHLDKIGCDSLYNSGSIYGCGKPFYVDISGNAIVCDYI